MNTIIFLILAILIPITAGAIDSVGIVAPIEATYTASAAFFTPYATPTDICSLAAGNSQTSSPSRLRVYHVRIWGTQTTAGINNFFLVKRSAPNTGGTSSAIAAITHDSHYPASLATVLKWTAAPTLGATVGTVKSAAIGFNLPAGSTNSGFDFDFGPNTGALPLILYPGESVSINFAGAAVPSGMSMSCEFHWAER